MTAARSRNIDESDLDDVFSGRRSKKAAPPPREEPKANVKSEPNYDSILAWFVEKRYTQIAGGTALMPLVSYPCHTR